MTITTRESRYHRDAENKMRKYRQELRVCRAWFFHFGGKTMTARIDKVLQPKKRKRGQA
jgi:hypothetical protein